jgi:hypothetical protein
LAGCKIQVEGKKTQEAIKPSFMPIMILCMWVFIWAQNFKI